MKSPANRISPEESSAPRVPCPEPVRCIVGDTVREVRIWTEEEWDRIDPAGRPSPAEHFPGLGWVGAVSGRKLG